MTCPSRPIEGLLLISWLIDREDTLKCTIGRSILPKRTPLSHLLLTISDGGVPSWLRCTLLQRPGSPEEKDEEGAVTS